MRTWLKNMRESIGVSRREMSNRLGVSPNHYSNIENGKRQADLSLSMTVRLAEIFGITIEQIAEYENKKSTEVGA